MVRLSPAAPAIPGPRQRPGYRAAPSFAIHHRPQRDYLALPRQLVDPGLDALGAPGIAGLYGLIVPRGELLPDQFAGKPEEVGEIRVAVEAPGEGLRHVSGHVWSPIRLSLQTPRRRGKASWELKFDVPNSDGTRQTRYVSVKGKRTDAQRELTRLLSAIDTGTLVEPSKLTVASYLRAWLDSADGSQRPWSATDSSRSSKSSRTWGP